MDGVDVFGKAAFLCEAFATDFTREIRRGRGRWDGGVNGGDVFGEVIFPCAA